MSADELVRSVIAAIPVGRVTTYGAIARAAGLGGDARRVGRAGLMLVRPNPALF